MRATFFDPAIEASFERNGFVEVPFLDQGAVAEVAEVYHRLGPAPGDPRISIHFDFQSTSVAYKESVRAALRPLLQPRIDALVDRYHLFSPAFIMKWPDARSGFAPHQDASIVDERRHRSLSIWCPLVDTVVRRGRDGAASDNGVLRFVPGSHRFAHWVRAQNPGPFLFDGLEGDIVARYGTAVPLRAGDAVVFDHRTVHFSLPNATSDPRLVVVMGMRPREADLLHYRRDERVTGPLEHFDVYEIDDDYYTRLDPFAVREGVPGYEQVDRISVERPVISGSAFEHLWAAAVGPRATGAARPARRWHWWRRRTEQVNARPFCFRCGTEADLVGDTTRVDHGNVQFLCTDCARPWRETGAPTLLSDR